MARPKNHRQYPMVFHELLDSLRESKPREIVWPTVADAKSFRLDFYAFIGAASKDPDMTDRVEGYPFLDSITVQVRDDPPRTILMRRDVTPMALNVAAALQKWREDEEEK